MPLLSEDYLIRQINLALAALAAIIGLKTASRHQEALVEIDSALEQLLGLKADLIRGLDDEKLLEHLMVQDQLDTDRLTVVADLFKEEGDIRLALQEPALGRLSYLRALGYYLEVALNQGSRHLPPPDEKIQALVEALDADTLPPETLFPLYLYYEARRRYRQAEETLDLLAADPEVRAAIQEERKDFYERLLALSDEELEAGGVSREEVEEGADDLNRR